MSANEKYCARFGPGTCYHVYNRTNNRERLFRCAENYHFFLRQYVKYISPFVSTYGYNLLPNHFHFVCRMLDCETIGAYLASLPAHLLLKCEKQFLRNPKENANWLMQAQFHRFFTSYSMAFNKVYDRKGNLFHRQFKRVMILDETQLRQTLFYVNVNAARHGLVDDFTDHPYSSWHSYFVDGPSLICRDEVFKPFGSRLELIRFHMDHLDFIKG
jgi:REP element-mobilizing transposase RayT